MEQADGVASLREAVEGLTYPSESDEPFDVVEWEAAEGVDLLALVEGHDGNGRKVEEVLVDDFFVALEEAEDAEQYQVLRGALESVVAELKVFRVGEGEVRVDVYLIGVVKGGRSIVGVHTVSVET